MTLVVVEVVMNGATFTIQVDEQEARERGLHVVAPKGVDPKPRSRSNKGSTKKGE